MWRADVTTEISKASTSALDGKTFVESKLRGGGEGPREVDTTVEAIGLSRRGGSEEKKCALPGPMGLSSALVS
jgi:hypothetical protein